MYSAKRLKYGHSLLPIRMKFNAMFKREAEKVHHSDHDDDHNGDSLVISSPQSDHRDSTPPTFQNTHGLKSPQIIHQRSPPDYCNANQNGQDSPQTVQRSPQISQKATLSNGIKSPQMSQKSPAVNGHYGHENEHSPPEALSVKERVAKLNSPKPKMRVQYSANGVVNKPNINGVVVNKPNTNGAEKRHLIKHNGHSNGNISPVRATTSNGKSNRAGNKHAGVLRKKSAPPSLVSSFVKLRVQVL